MTPDKPTTPAPSLLAKTVTARDLSKREWQVLRDAATFSNGYYWSPRTCVKLCDRGLMFRDLHSSGHPYKLTSQGYALLDDTYHEAVKAMEVTL